MFLKDTNKDFSVVSLCLKADGGFLAN